MKGNFKGKISVLVILIVSILLGFYTYVSISEQREINDDTLAFLKAQGVDLEEDIVEMEIVDIGKEKRKLAVAVRFSGEEEFYLYTYDEQGTIYELDGY